MKTCAGYVEFEILLFVVILIVYFLLLFYMTILFYIGYLLTKVLKYNLQYTSRTIKSKLSVNILCLISSLLVFAK